MPILHRVTLKNKKGEAIFPKIDDNIIIDQDGNMSLLRGNLILSEGKLYGKVDKNTEFEAVSTSNVNYISYPSDGRRDDDFVDGYLKIIPPFIDWDGTDLKFKISIFCTIDKESCDYFISGTYGKAEETWICTTAYSIGDSTNTFANLPIRFARENNKPIIYIGANNTSWSHPRVRISDISVVSDKELSSFISGWKIEYNKEEGVIDNLIEHPAVYYCAMRATADADGNTISSTYLKLSGGTITGNLIVDSDTTIKGRLDTASIEPKDSGGTYYVGSNSFPYKEMHATTFYGALSGNASSATNANNIYIDGVPNPNTTTVYLLGTTTDSGYSSYIYRSPYKIRLPQKQDSSSDEVVITGYSGSFYRTSLLYACSSGNSYSDAQNESIIFLWG